MRYLSVCSGIESATAAWHTLGWQPVAFSEIEPFPCAVLAHHYPDVPNWGDMTKFKEWPDADIDVLVGGTPCQSFSVAGLRKGLDDPRGNLMLTYLAIAGRYRPKWLVWENVPGVLSSNGGKDFGTFLGGLAELGYGFAYRVLDAQYFGVAQRRRRVFVVGCFGDWRAAAAVLFERHSLSGHPAPSREAGQVVAGTLASRTEGGGFPGTDEACSGYVQPVVVHGTQDPLSSNIVFPLGRNGGQENAVFALQHAQIGRKPEAGPQGKGRQSNVSFTLDSRPCADAVAYSVALRGREGGATAELGDEIAGCLRASTGGGDKPHVLAPVACMEVAGTMKACKDSEGWSNSADHAAAGYMQVTADMQVRRLTPVECERLQGFPDEYANIKFKGKPVGDGHRYKALGNSKAVPVVQWLGLRIDSVNEIMEPA